MKDTRQMVGLMMATSLALGACVQFESDPFEDDEAARLADEAATIEHDLSMRDTRGPTGEPHGPVDTIWNGTYSVPVPAEDLELVAAARYEVGMIHGRVVDTGNARSLEVTFTLPASLLGADAAIALSGPLPTDAALAAGELIAVSGFDGTGTCVLAPALACDITYYQAGVDLPAVEAYWIARGATAGQVASRVRVSQLFDADPLGVLEADATPE